MRQLYRRKHFSGKTIRRYSTTILLLGSMSSYASAQAIHEMYADKSFENALQQSMVAEFSLAYDDIATALHNYTVLAIRSNSTTIKQRALDIALEYNDLQAALDIATHWVEQEPTDVPALFYLSHIALKTHEYELAAETLDKILNIDPTADLEEILAGIAPEQPQDRDILLNALRASKEKNNPSILALIAGLEAQNGLYEQALNNINRALRKRSKSTSFILMKANLLISLQDDEATKDWFAKASRRNKDNLDIRLAEARYYIQINEQKEALSKLESIIKDHPDAQEALFIAGLTSIDLKQYEKAEQYLVDLRTSAKYQNEAYYYLAINAQRKQHYETAKAYYRLVDGSLYITSRRNMIAIFDKQDQLNDALRFLTQERVNYPQHASFLYQAQADILKKMNNKKAALALLDEAIKNLPDDPELIYAEVLLLDPFTDRDKLDKTLKQLLVIEPNSPTYLNAYAYTLALQNRRLKEARKYAELALEYAPEQASILDTLGYIAFLQNDFDTAVKVLGQAYALSQNVNIGIRYAKALYMQGALTQFSDVLQQLKQNHANAPQLQQLDSLILPVTVKKS
ncbi:MAG: tetratricopeptide repeat protein [Proteobacteria bacterium]|uniref:tetratricopeptide repeat protein n=1 Tax=Acinetobacter venetianus TaxID=52133 RepID=UPI0004777001|nr:tetratricopeptide repeat protein [Acinetobacter venetianus]MCR4531150.1 tetratricopeptide repeat protein [Acinetobacter venetianus]MDA0697914.1 tetratricopeptide repeat protein [Pseudomonadota bacterium]MDA1255726.1 tetratricopeptide repeat protein [Pseudomonadota bacterium]